MHKLIGRIINNIGHGGHQALEAPVLVDALPFALQGPAPTGITTDGAAARAAAPGDERFDVADGRAAPREAEQVTGLWRGATYQLLAMLPNGVRLIEPAAGPTEARYQQARPA